MRRRRAIRSCRSPNTKEQIVDTVADTLVEIRVSDKDSMDHCLNAAVERMIEVALQGPKHGIRVTRLGAGHFTVGLSDAVPFGRTEQRDAWNRSC
jgi:hypothetical protein